jgi:hypothetical protein
MLCIIETRNDATFLDNNRIYEIKTNSDVLSNEV